MSKKAQAKRDKDIADGKINVALREEMKDPRVTEILNALYELITE